MNDIYITIVRPGKSPVTVGVAPGSTVRTAFQAANISEADFGTWHITDEAGRQLSLDAPLNSTTQLVCGARVSGA